MLQLVKIPKDNNSDTDEDNNSDTDEKNNINACTLPLHPTPSVHVDVKDPRELLSRSPQIAEFVTVCFEDNNNNNLVLKYKYKLSVKQRILLSNKLFCDKLELRLDNDNVNNALYLPYNAHTGSILFELILNYINGIKINYSDSNNGSDMNEESHVSWVEEMGQHMDYLKDLRGSDNGESKSNQSFDPEFGISIDYALTELLEREAELYLKMSKNIGNNYKEMYEEHIMSISNKLRRKYGIDYLVKSTHIEKEQLKRIAYYFNKLQCFSVNNIFFNLVLKYVFKQTDPTRKLWNKSYHLYSFFLNDSYYLNKNVQLLFKQFEICFFDNTQLNGQNTNYIDAELIRIMNYLGMDTNHVEYPMCTCDSCSNRISNTDVARQSANRLMCGQLNVTTLCDYPRSY